MAKLSFDIGKSGREGFDKEGIDEGSQGQLHSKKEGFDLSHLFESQMYLFNKGLKELDEATATKYKAEVEKIQQEIERTGKIPTSVVTRMNEINLEIDGLIVKDKKPNDKKDFRSNLEGAVYSEEDIASHYAQGLLEDEKIIAELDKDMEALKADVEKEFG